jgi:hypothetical protein
MLITFGLPCMMQDEEAKFCGAEVRLGAGGTSNTSGVKVAAPGAVRKPVAQQGGWFQFSMPLSIFACEKGSAGSLAAIDRIDFQNTELRDAEICLDEIKLV